ncbi:MAG: sulfotransferase [Pseudomonadota bacterium]
MMPSGRKAPIIIIGAGRSGTNVLRDCLTAANGLVTWPCDEINLIWRHGNLRHPTDVFGAAQANASVRHYIQSAFDQICRKEGGDTVVEKTCANTLRVPFIDAIFPDARYINIVRDGRDVTASAMKRWRSSVDWPYMKRIA